jgi:diguanylate cyclase (GGDEF)-like protein
VTMFKRFKQPTALVCIDVDRFKSINDTYSHLAGDAVLKAVTRCLTGEIRGSDIVGRIGGEEFLVVLPRTDLTEARDMAERLRQAVEGLVVPWRSQSISCTICCGVAQCMWSDDASSFDLALYRAKETGRNRTETRAKPIEPTASGSAEPNLSAAMGVVQTA